MNTKDLISHLAKGAPDATIIMTPAELKGFADSVIKECRSSAPRGGGKLRGLSATSEQAEVVQAIKAIWPKCSTSRLAYALGVSRPWICKLLAKDLTAEQQLLLMEEQEKCAAATLDDVEDIITKIKTDSNGNQS